MARSRAWRRSKDEARAKRQALLEHQQAARLRGADSYWKFFPAEKNWKNMYTRSEKTRRARQLGFDYPRKTQREVLAEHMDLAD